MVTTEEIRKSMRISHHEDDDEISNNIAACLADMKRIGVDTQKDSKLIDKACEIYCKAQFDFQGKGEKYNVAYEKLRDGMSMSEDYKCTMK